jgi:hypothetical protein
VLSANGRVSAASPRFVYLVTSHRNPEQVARLVGTLRVGSPKATIVIHHDETASHLDAARFAAMDDVRILPFSVPVDWGGFSLVDMNLRCFAWIARHIDFDWLVLLSGQDYPIRPLPELERFVEAQQADAFIGTMPDWESFRAGIAPSTVPARHRLVQNRIERHPDSRFIRYTAAFRYFYRYYSMPDLGVHGRIPWRARRWLRKVGARLQPVLQTVVFVHPAGRDGSTRIGFRRLRTPFSDAFRCYKASAWFTLSRRAVGAITEFVAAHPSYVAYFRRTIIPDESFVQTIVLNDKALTIFDDNLVYFTWSNAGSGSPDVLTLRDLPAITGSGKFLARKFDLDVDEEVLDRLDEIVLPGTA